jgi:serine/threonine protein phosphatase PrpC
MSRSLGDRIAHSIGVTSIPEVQCFKINYNDKFVIIGSDGLWEFLSNTEVGNIVYPYYLLDDPEKSANEVVKAAFRQWRKKESSMVDDITVVVIFLKPDLVYRQ